MMIFGIVAMGCAYVFLELADRAPTLDWHD